MSARGRPTLQAWEQRLVDERLAVYVTQRCALCPWTLKGPLRLTRDAFLAHRLEAHPELKPAPRRKRHRPYGQLQGMKSLDDNIAQARKSGAAGWAAPE